MKLLLFDIDGTLIGSNGAGIRAMTAAGRALFGEQFSFDGLIAAGGLDTILFSEAAATHGLEDHHLHHDRFHDRYVDQLASDFETRASQARPKPGVIDLLGELRGRSDVRLGIVSGNFRRAADIKLMAAGIDPGWFAVTGYADDGPDRPALVRHAIDAFESGEGVIARRDVIVIGDTPRDVHCAHANGCIAFAVATGPYSTTDLSEAGADVAVQDLTNASALVDLLDR